MKYTGKWLIAGSYDNEKIIDFELQMKSELPNFNYEDFVKNDPELQQILIIDENGNAQLHTKNALDEIIFGKLEGDVINFENESVKIKAEKGYLVFCVEGGFVFKKI